MGTGSPHKLFIGYASKGLTCVLITTVLFMNFGCEPKHQALSLETHLDLHTRKIALVPSAQPIRSSLNVPAQGWKEGFVFGAEQAAFDTTRYFIEGGSCRGELCAFVVLVYLSALATGVTVGSVYGAMTSPSAETVMTMEKGLIDKVGAAFTQQTFAELVKKNASENPNLNMHMVVLEGETSEIGQPDFDALKDRGFQQAIIVSLMDIAFIAEKGKNPPLTMSMIAVAEIVNFDRPTEKTSRTYRYLGPKAYYNEWLTKEGFELQQDFNQGLLTLAESIYHDIFFAFDLPISSGNWDFPGLGNLYGCCWICPDTPPLDYSFWGMHLRYPQVESVRPTLTWSSFPDERQAKEFSNATGRRIEDVRYDVKIWQGYGGDVFQINNVTENYYTLETDLAPQNEYFWSMRACFGNDEKRICTPWAKSTIPAIPTPVTEKRQGPYCEQPASIDHHFRFRTP